MKESPDVIYYGDDDLSWLDSKFNPWAFMTFKTFSVIGLSYTHYAIMDVLMEVRRKKAAKSWLNFYINGRTTFKVSDVDALIKEVKDPNTPVGKYLKSRVRGRQHGDAEIYRTKFGLTGRIWEGKKMMAFWNTRQQVLKEFSSLEKLFMDFPKELGDMNEYQIDWVERVDTSSPLTPMTGITKSNDSKDSKQGDFMNALFGRPQDLPKLTPEQIRKIQQKVHTLPPEQKKKALEIMGVKNVKAADIANKLGMTVAEFNHIMQINESEMLQENPDGIYSTTGARLTRWSDSHAYAFYIFDTCCVMIRSGTHFDMAKTLVYASQDENPTVYIKNSPDELIVSDWDKMEQEMKNKNSSLGKLIAHYRDAAEARDTTISNLPDQYYYDGRTEYGVAGRAWPRSQMISFWKNQGDVLKLWDRAEFLFACFPSFLGSLDDYQVDTADRDELDHESDLIPVKKITASRTTASTSGTDDKQMKFLGALFAAPKSLPQLTDKQKKAIRQKLHTLPPEKKQKALMMMGVRNTKAIEIAEKLGMTVAEFNHIMQINEDEMPKLGDIIKEIQ